MTTVRRLAAIALIAAACNSGSATPTATRPAVPATTIAATSPAPPATTPTAPPTTTARPAPSTTTTTLPMDEAATSARMLRDLDAIRTLGPRVEGSEAELTALAWIERTLAEVTGVEVSSSDVPLPQGTTSRNVWVDLGSTGTPWIMFGAHVDSVTGSPGIDDNGSGVALLLELARRLAADPVNDRRVTLVFFGAEEVRPGGTSNDHHYGSRAMAGAMAAEGALPDLMVSVDMVGVGDRLWAVPYRDMDPSAAEALVAAGDTVGVEISLVSRGDISDHEAFARAGTPAAMLWRPDNPAWHTANDTVVVESHLLDDLAVLERLLRFG